MGNCLNAVRPQPPIGYVFTSTAEGLKLDDAKSKARPRFEFDLFLEREGAQAVTFDDIPRAGSVPRLLSRIGRSAPAVALAALRNTDYRSIITSGENVGFAAAFFSSLDRTGPSIDVVTHGSFFGSRYMPSVARLLRANRRVRYLTLCNSLRNQMIGRFGFPEDRVINTGYGVDTEFFEPRPLPERARPVIASAGAATRDYRTLVAATQDLTADIRIAADSSWFPTAVDVSRDRLPANCDVRSYGNYSGLRELYASADFVVVPLYPAFHACGLAVIAEAMAMGKAVITTRIEGRSDFVIEGENAFYVEPGDVAGLRARIDELLRDPARAREMGAAARRQMVQRFSLEAYVERMVEGRSV